MKNLTLLNEMLTIGKVKKRTFILLGGLALVSSFLEVLPTEILGFFANILVSWDKESVVKRMLLCGGVYFLVVLMGTLIRNMFCYITSKCANKIIRNIRTAAYRKLLLLDLMKLDNEKTGYAINMIDGNTSRLETVFSVALFTLISDIFDLLWISIFIAIIDWKLLVLLCAFLPVLYILGLKSSKTQNKFAKKKINSESRIISKISETVKNIVIIRTSRGKARESGSFNTQTENYEQICNQADLKISIFYILEKSIRYIAITLVMIIVAMNIIEGRQEVGSLITITLYSQRFYSPVTNIIRYLQMLQKGMASIEELHVYFQREEIDTHRNICFSKEVEFIDMDHASVESEDRVILKPFNLQLRSKGLYLIKGKSGSGKTTLIRTLLGEQPLTHGFIRVNPVLQDKVIFSYASQNTELFNTSIIDNVLYPLGVEESTAEKQENAKKLLQEFGFSSHAIFQEIEGIEQVLSGGEKKRIIFIRAILSEAPVLLLDEVTSNLDVQNENKMLAMI